MKNIIKIVLPVLLLTISCKAQIESLEDYDGKGVSGKYYKDLNNVLDPFAGTYLYTNGNKLFKVVLQKMEHSSMGGVYYEDLLIGEYEYKIDNVIVVSTLNRLNNTYENGASHAIDGNNILRGGSRACRSCPASEIFIDCGLVDGNSANIANVFIQRISVSGQPAIKFSMQWEMRGVDKSAPPVDFPGSTAPNRDASFPGGDYIMIKQP